MSFASNIFGIAGISIQVEIEVPIDREKIFAQNLTSFLVDATCKDNIQLRHHISLPDINNHYLGELVYRVPPWAIYRNSDGWTYMVIPPQPTDPYINQVAYFNNDYSSVHIYTPGDSLFRKGNLTSLTLFPTDQIWLARVFADRQGCYLHAAGMVLEDQGFLFVGHSSAGKSTIVTMLKDEGEILCDDRMIVRRWPEGFRIHGTWSHGEVPDVSPGSAPLRAIFLLEQAPDNQVIPVTDHREIVRTLPFFVIKPLVTTDWWEKMLDLIAAITREVPVFRLQFDKSGEVRQVIKALLH